MDDPWLVSSGCLVARLGDRSQLLTTFPLPSVPVSSSRHLNSRLGRAVGVPLSTPCDSTFDSEIRVLVESNCVPRDST